MKESECGEVREGWVFEKEDAEEEGCEGWRTKEMGGMEGRRGEGEGREDMVGRKNGVNE